MSKALGRGFESLIPTDLIDEEFDLTSKEDEKVSKLISVPIEKIVRDEDQPRKKFDEEALEALAQSIKENGILQPIVATKDGDKYKIVAGERRWRAGKLAGLTEVPVIVRTVDAQNRLELSVIENAQREDLNPIELATAYAKLKTQFNFSEEEIGKKIGKSAQTIVGTMRLLKLPEEVKKIMVEHNLSEGVMRPLISADDEVIKKVLPKIVYDGWSARMVEKFVAENKKKPSTTFLQRSKFEKDEKRISEKYQATAKIRGRSITLTCESKEKLIELLAKLG